MSHADQEPSATTAEALTYDDLLRPFAEACKPPDQWRVGIEAERFGLVARTGKPIHYDGHVGILGLFQALVSGRGWTPEAENAGGPVVSLSRAQAAVTLEPGSQLELSGAPHPDLHDLGHEVLEHALELREVSEPLGIRWLGLGFHPLARQDDLGWVPKSRYAIMRVYLATRGSQAHEMMRRTATVQANFDYASEEDALRKLRVALRMSPVISTMFANSPFVEGAPFGGKSRRMLVWLDVDPDRQGLLPALWREGASLHDYVEWALDVPMFLFKRRGAVIQNTGQTFRSFMTDGYAGHRPIASDWAMHLNTLFPEVRLKRTLEVRGADSVPARLMPALPALWTGLLYDDTALEQAESLTASWAFDELQALRTRGAAQGLSADFQGKPLAKTAERFVQIARDGLVRRGRRDAQGRDESVWLDGLGDLVSRGRTPADELLERVDPSGPLLAQLLDLAPA